jgi:hypothetical protein
MSIRMLLVKHATQHRPEIWEVLSPDLREQEFQGTHEECVQYLRNQCPNGSCEE